MYGIAVLTIIVTKGNANMGRKKYVMVHNGSVRAAGLVVFRCRAQAAAPDTAEWLLLQAVDRQDNTAPGDCDHVSTPGLATGPRPRATWR